VNAAESGQLLEDARQYHWLRLSGSILMASATYLAPRHSAFRSRTLPSGLAGRRSPSKRRATLIMNKARFAALVTAVSETFLKSSRPQYCLASRSPQAELDLEAQAIIVDQRVIGERQVATEQHDMGPSLGLQIDFDQDTCACAAVQVSRH